MARVARQTVQLSTGNLTKSNEFKKMGLLKSFRNILGFFVVSKVFCNLDLLNTYYEGVQGLKSMRGLL